MEVRLKPHHFVCIHGFRGKGYSPPFIHGFTDLVQKLKADENTKIKVVYGADVICQPCPNLRGDGCVEQIKISKLDSAYGESLEVKQNQTLTWAEVEHLVATKVTMEQFENNCEPCEWKALGYCRDALVDLKKKFGVSLVLAGFFIFLAQSSFSLASPAATEGSVETSVAATEPIASADVSIDELDAILIKKKTKFFGTLKQANDALNIKRYSASLVFLRKTPALGEYADYVHYLSGLAELGLLREHAKAGRVDAGLASGERAFRNFIKIVTLKPSGSLLKRAQILLGETDVETGELLSRGKHYVRAQKVFENGFLRLLQSGLLILVPQRSIVTYAILCEKKPNELCSSWVERLSTYLDKNEDQKLVKKLFVFKPSIKPPKKPSSSYSVAMDLQAFTRGYFMYIAGDLNSAYETWYALLKDYPNTNIKLRTKFWMGRAAQRTNHPLQSQTLYKEIIRDAPFAYYALLASWFGKIDLSRMIDAGLPLATRKSDNSDPGEIVQLHRAEELVANDLSELARIELKDMRISDTMPNEFLVYLAYLNHRAKAHRVVSQIYSELSSRGYTGMFSSFGEKLMFPSTFMEQVTKAANEQHIDSMIPISIIKQESAFDYEAVSSANAYGLMQIIRPTAKDLDPDVTVPDLLIPERNVKLGTKYIAQLLKRYNGSLIHALAAYNAGPHNSDRWRREISQDLPPEEYIELITFKETREYVQAILRNRYWYKRILRGEVVDELEKLTH